MSKTVLITGCSKGFGYLFALHLARAGFQVAATSRNISRMQELATIAKQESLPIRCYECDVTKPKTIDQTLSRVKHDFGQIDILINNAGYGLYAFIEHATPQEVEDHFKTNVYGLVAVSQAVIPLMKKQQSGHIINISSAAAGGIFPAMGVYAASKWAVEAISEALYFELKPAGIQVSLIQPGPYYTDFGKSSVRNQKLDIRFDQKKQKLQAPFKGNPEEVANLVVKVAKSRRPKLRYPVGNAARLVFFLRKSLPHDWFIKLQEKVLGI